MIKREIEIYSVVGFQESKSWYATANDFQSDYQGTTLPGAEIVKNSAPYAINFNAERVLNVVYDSNDHLLSSTFLCHQQKQSAKTLISIPYECLQEVADISWGMTIASAAPVFVFSVGRAGSTLLSKLLSTITIASLSEPDVFTQLSLLAVKQGNEKIPRLQHMSEVISYSTMGLLHVCQSHRGAIKFRSQLNNISHLVMQSLPEANGFMLLRNSLDCAKSFYRAFGWSAAEIAYNLALALKAVHNCKNVGRPIHVLYYEDLCANPYETLRSITESLNMPESVIEACKINAVMSMDSQYGTFLARENLSDQTVPSDFVTEFQHEWSTCKQQLENEGVDILIYD